MNAEYRGKMPLPHRIQECPDADSQARYTAKLILPLVLAELNSYKYFNKTIDTTVERYNFTEGEAVSALKDAINNPMCYPFYADTPMRFLKHNDGKRALRNAVNFVVTTSVVHGTSKFATTKPSICLRRR